MQQAPILEKIKSEQKIARIAAEIQEKLYNTNNLCFLGIGDKGMALAEKIMAQLPDSLEIEMHLANKKNIPLKSFLPKVNFEGKTVIVVDDVLESGRTLMHVCSAVMLQHPAQIKTVILVDRMHPKFPIKADFVGVTLSTTLQNHVDVRFEESGISAYLI